MGQSYTLPRDAASNASRAYSVVPLPQMGALWSTPGSTATRGSPLCLTRNSFSSSRTLRFWMP